MDSGGKRDRAERDPIRHYTDLTAWQKARILVREIYLLTRGFPKEETYGLSQQLRRAAVSIVSNIAEGYGRGNRKEYLHFLRIARGSLYEVETQLMVAEDMGWLASGLTKVAALKSDCSRLLNALINSLERTE